ncbi:MAG: hypothetical protein HYY93_06545 [Planctomycetes bacterium]|nr:hypothetical protein [Planctomycetota bacterium]
MRGAFFHGGLFVCALNAVACADTLHLKAGGRVEGVFTREGETYRVVTKYGTCTVPAAEVASIERKSGLVEKFLADRGALAVDDLDGHWALAEWARASGAPGLRRIACEDIVRIDRDHSEARKLLGHEKVGDEWLPHDAAMAARGYQKVGDRWLSPEEAQALAEATEKQEHARLVNRKLDSCLKRMGCGSPTLRSDGHREMRAIAKTENMPRVLEIADEVKEYYDAVWRVIAELQSQDVTLTTIATNVEVKSLRTLPINPGAENPTNIQLPFLKVTQVKTTVIVPAAPWVPRNWWALHEEP